MTQPRVLPNWMEGFLEYSGFGEAPEDTLFWSGVATVAGALRRNVWIDEIQFQWYPNHYIVLVAPPGIIAKTTTMNHGMKLLREVPGIKFGPSASTWQALVEQMALAHEEVSFPDGSFIPSCALTVASGELGNFLNVDDQQMLNILIEMFDANQGSFDKVTKMAGSDRVVNPWLNFIACTTPSWIASNFSDITTQGGFVSRCVFIFADKKERLVAYPSRSAPKGLSKLTKALVQDLEAISQMRGQMRLTEDAYQYGEELYQQHWSSSTQNTDMERFGGYWARKQTHLHKLSMVLSAVEGPELWIERRHLEEAQRRLTVSEKNLDRVFELIGRTSDSRIANEILTLVTRVGSISRSRLHAYFLSRYGRDEMNRGIDSCFAAGKISSEQLPNGDVHIRLVRPGTVPTAAPVPQPAYVSPPIQVQPVETSTLAPPRIVELSLSDPPGTAELSLESVSFPGEPPR